jgi:type I restriction enzyme, R subunit
MSDLTAERTFQDVIVGCMLTNGWQLGQPEKYNRELAVCNEKYPEDVMGFVQQTQDGP